MIGFLNGLVFAHDSFLFNDKDLSIPIDMKLEKFAFEAVFSISALFAQ
jgi:hypothetical protein